MSGLIELKDGGVTLDSWYLMDDYPSERAFQVMGRAFTVRYVPGPAAQSPSFGQMTASIDTLCTRLLDLITAMREDVDYWKIRAAEWQAKAEQLSEKVAQAS